MGKKALEVVSTSTFPLLFNLLRDYRNVRDEKRNWLGKPFTVQDMLAKDVHGVRGKNLTTEEQFRVNAAAILRNIEDHSKGASEWLRREATNEAVRISGTQDVELIAELNAKLAKALEETVSVIKRDWLSHQLQLLANLNTHLPSSIDNHHFLKRELQDFIQTADDPGVYPLTLDGHKDYISDAMKIMSVFRKDLHQFIQHKRLEGLKKPEAQERLLKALQKMTTGELFREGE